MNQTTQEFDYIIAGAGMAGLSLAYRISRSSLRDCSVLIIDRDEKTSNDHTWCFWEKEESLFEEIVACSWDKLLFRGVDYEEEFEISPYSYKMIRSSDYYAFCKRELEANSNVEFLNAEVLSIGDGVVETSNGEFRGFVFDSISRPEYANPRDKNLVQPFLGKFIKTKDFRFDKDVFTMFDFGVEQADDCRFVYVLPMSESEALVEYTLFSNAVPEAGFLEQELNSYLARNFGGYEVLESEKGVIPMSDANHVQRPYRNVVRIGQAGGYVKPSTGYSFQRTQRRLERIVSRLEESYSTKTSFRVPESHSPWKELLDTVLLDVLENNRHPAAGVFTDLFRSNGARTMLRFLDEDTSLTEDLRVMTTVPLLPFSVAASKIIAKKILG